MHHARVVVEAYAVLLERFEQALDVAQRMNLALARESETSPRFEADEWSTLRPGDLRESRPVRGLQLALQE